MNAFARAARRKAMLRLHEHQIEFSPEMTLVIVDMQELFINEDEEDIIPNIIALIRHAIAKKWAIIVVEYDGSGETDQEITQTLHGYPHQETVIKYGQDGGKEVVDCLESHPAWSASLLVCGIYGPDCVAQTIQGIFANSDVAEVDVVADAVCPPYENCHGQERSEGLATMEELGIPTTEGSVV